MQHSSLEYRLQASDRLCFIHIPKTAGTTFTTIIDSQFHLEDISPDPRFLSLLIPQEFAQIDITKHPEKLNSFKLIRGHFSYGFIQSLLPVNTLYLTILRNPIDQAISLYEFFKRARERGEPESEEYQLLMEATSQGLKHFLLHPHPTVQRWTSNLQARFLGSAFPDLPDPSNAKMLVQAKQNLEQFVFVGLTERFQDSITLLNYIFGWYPSASYPNLRVAAKKTWKDSLEPELLALLHEKNQVDIDLYHYAEAIFEKRFSLMLDELKSRHGLTDPISSDQVHFFLEEHYQKRFIERQPSAIQVLDFNFRQPISGTGWHQRNGKYNGLERQAPVFRWMGPATRSTLDFLLAKTEDLVIKIRVNNAIAPDVLSSLTLTVNQTPIPLHILAQKGKQTFFYGFIPKAALESQPRLTRLTFNINRTVPYRSLNPSNPDDRLVGLAFSQIQIFPASTHPDEQSYLSLLFPFHDSHWAEVIHFLQPYLQSSEKLAAPPEFIEPFPDQFTPYTASFYQDQAVSWVILHKGHLSDVETHSLQWVIQNFNPVFTNSVFVIFSNRQNLGSLSLNSTELNAFFNQIKGLNTSQPFTSKLINSIIKALKNIKHSLDTK